MKISELKQPYRRMAESLERQNCIQEASQGIYNFYKNKSVEEVFWNAVDAGEQPPITDEIKIHFPADFDFSGEEQPLQLPNNPIIQNRIYTMLAKEGKFDQLPDTCEFSEPVELLVWDNVEPIKMNDSDLRLVSGKFRGVFIAQNSHASNIYVIWQYAKLPTLKIDFSQFKSGDVVEVELSNEEKRIGWFDYTDRNQVVIKTLQRKGNQVCNGGSCSGNKMFNLEKIKSITKIK